MTSRTPTSSRRLTAAAALLTGIALMGTACTAGQAPPSAAPSDASTSTYTSPTPSATATPIATASYKPADAKGRAQNVPVPVLPEAAKAKTKEGLEAFARYWFEQLNFAYETGNTSGLSSITSENCEFCSNIRKALQKNYQGDRWLVGGRIKAPSMNTNFGAESEGTYQVVVQVQQAKITYLNADGSEFRSPTPPSDTGNVMLTAFRNGSWQVTALHPIR